MYETTFMLVGISLQTIYSWDTPFMETPIYVGFTSGREEPLCREARRGKCDNSVVLSWENDGTLRVLPGSICVNSGKK